MSPDIQKLQEEIAKLSEENTLLSKDRQRLSSLLNRWRYLRQTILNPAVLTVIATAIAGPLIVSSVNNGLKEKELALTRETKIAELRTSMMNSLTKFAFNTDFSKSYSIDRIEIIAQMLNENDSVFGLTFNETLREFDSLSNNLTNSTIEQNRKQIISLQTDTATMKSQVKNLLNERLKINKKRAQGKITEQEQKNRLQKLAAEIDLKRQTLNLKEEQIKSIKEENTLMENKLQQQEELNKQIEQENNKNKKIIEKLRTTGEITDQKAKQLLDKLATATENIRTLRTEIENLKKENTNLHKDNINLRERNNFYMKKIKELETKTSDQSNVSSTQDSSLVKG